MFGRSGSGCRRSFLRATALASALALTLGTSTDAYGLHHCPHHDALPGEVASPSGDGDSNAPRALHAAAASADHATHGVPSTHEASAGSTHDAPEHDGGCTCVGDCAHAGTAGVMPSRASATVTATASLGRIATMPAEAPLVAHIPHLLPFAHGPPLDR